MCASGRGNVWVSSQITSWNAQSRAPLPPYKQSGMVQPLFV